MANLQDQSVANANAIFGILREIVPMLGTITGINNSYNNLNMASVLSAMPTATQNADGSTTPDTGSPATGHPIDITKISKLEIAVSAYDIGVMMTLLQQMSALFNGATVAQQTTAPTSLAKVTDVP
jgi:hypothetical protein